jgi:hypothetical protein
VNVRSKLARSEDADKLASLAVVGEQEFTA